jgi:sec-independent protein translocase protein TatC
MANNKPSSRASAEPEMAVMSLGQHLEELRARVIICLLAIGGAFVVCWVFREELRVVVLRPHVLAMRALELDTALKFSSYLESFVAQLKTCTVFALVLVSPVIIYQLWAFIAPGLFPHERRRSLKLAAACIVCVVAGVCFGYFVFLPVALRYLISLSGGWAEPVLMISSYLALVFMLTVALAAAFQTPVIIFYLIRWGVITPESLRRHRKAVILAAFIIGAVLTPPDPMTQMMMASTLIVLYDLGGLVAAPSRPAFRNFFGFTGAIVVAGGVALAWFHLWPVGRLTALKGDVRIGQAVVAAGQTVGVKRGRVCRTGSDGVAEIKLSGGDGAVVDLAPDGRLQVHSRTGMSLYAGRCLAESREDASELTVRAAPGKALLAGGRAEFDVPDPDALTVTTFAGTVQVTAGGQDRHVAAGQTATFRTGGEPADVSDAESRWRRLIGSPAPSP